MSIEMSSAFDMVDFITLERKMEIYTFVKKTIERIKSYLQFRLQYEQLDDKCYGN